VPGSGPTTGAEASFRAAIALRPDRAAPWNNLGSALASQERYDEDGAAFARSVELSQGQFPDAVANLGRLRVVEGRWAEAIPLLRRANTTTPGVPVVRESLRTALANQSEVLAVAGRTADADASRGNRPRTRPGRRRAHRVRDRRARADRGTRTELGRSRGGGVMIKPVNIGAELADLPVLSGRTPHTSDADARAAFAVLAPFRDGSIFAGRFSGDSKWERHPNGDELVQILAGAATLTIMTDGGPESFAMTAGTMIVVPQGHWHRFHAPEQVTVLTATPQPTEHTLAADPRA
jgi:mannose-6-phosphate isomerase-like protein (cupin superfamily)